MPIGQVHDARELLGRDAEDLLRRRRDRLDLVRRRVHELHVRRDRVAVHLRVAEDALRRLRLDELALAEHDVLHA